MQCFQIKAESKDVKKLVSPSGQLLCRKEEEQRQPNLHNVMFLFSVLMFLVLRTTTIKWKQGNFSFFFLPISLSSNISSYICQTIHTNIKCAYTQTYTFVDEAKKKKGIKPGSCRNKLFFQLLVAWNPNKRHDCFSSIQPSIRSSIHLPICPSRHLFIYPSLCLSN